MNQPIAILMSDFYKQSHAEQYPEGTTKLVSYATARMSRMPQRELIVFGIQAFVKKWLIEEFNETFFSKPFSEAEDYYKWVIGNTFPLKYVGIEKFKKLHELGYLPIEVACIPEGTRVPVKSAEYLPEGQCQVPFMRITNTHKDFAWLVEFIESLTSAEIWYPMCVANQAALYRGLVNKWYNITGCDKGARKSAISEFGFRGGKGTEAAIMASSAFLTSFNKTATIPAIIYNEKYYNEPIENGNIGSGMISTEHSVMCSNYAIDRAKLEAEAKLLVVNKKENGSIMSNDIKEFNTGDVVTVQGDSDLEDKLYIVVRKPNGQSLEQDTQQLEYPVYTEFSSGEQSITVAHPDDDSEHLVLLEINVEGIFLMKLFKEIYPTGAVSVVMDSYDYWRNIAACGDNELLHRAIMSRDGTVFFRGDSGDPVDIICGEPMEEYRDLLEFSQHLYHHNDEYSVGTVVYITNGGRYLIKVEDESIESKLMIPGWDFIDKDSVPFKYIGTVEMLYRLFGGQKNEAGYKVLDSHVRAIYGDSITPYRAEKIYARLARKGFAACNVALGAGSFSMQCSEVDDGRIAPFTRDTYGIAVKACYAENEDGTEYQIFKNPKTDTGKFKKSQKGLVLVTKNRDGDILAYDGYTATTYPKTYEDLMKPIFRDGKMMNETSLAEVRDRVNHGDF